MLTADQDTGAGSGGGHVPLSAGSGENHGPASAPARYGASAEADAAALAEFITAYDTRYRARVLAVPPRPGRPEAERLVLVILTDRHTGGNPPPLSDADDYAALLIRERRPAEMLARLSAWRAARAAGGKVMG